MQLRNHALIGSAAKIPTNPASPVISFSPVVLPIPGREVDLQVRVSFPATTSTNTDGKDNDAQPLPIVLLSHGHGRSNYLSSLEGYTPVSDFLAGHGFVVLQPTHLSSKSLGLAVDDTNIRQKWFEWRAKDMSDLLDRLDAIEAAIPLLRGRLDRERVAVAGHSLGGMTACALLGMTNRDPRDSVESSLRDERIKAGVVFGGTGAGGADLSDNGRVMLPFYGPSFEGMSTPALIIWGENDVGPHLTVRGADWHADPYSQAPAPKASFLVRGGQHGFGGISGWDTLESKDESPERLSAVLRVTWAYLRSQLYEGDKAWEEARLAIEGLEELGKIETK